MIRQVMTAPGIIEFREAEIPGPGEGRALVKMMWMRTYGSDIHVYHGEHPYTSYPMIQGHEASGEAVKTGPGVEYLKEGQKVTVEPRMFCGQCYLCTYGEYNDCDNLKVMGFQTMGAASEYFVADTSKIDALPEGVLLNKGAMIEPLVVIIHTVKRYSDTQGASACALGYGPIDILVAQSCKALGAAKVMVTNASDYRLEMAKAAGADYAVNTGEHDPETALTDCFGSDKADVIYDCTGNDITMNQATQNCHKGGTIILVAVSAGEARIDLTKLNDSELGLNTSFIYTHEDCVDAIRLMGKGKIKLTPPVSKHSVPGEFTETYRHINDNREQTMRVIINIQS